MNMSHACDLMAYEGAWSTAEDPNHLAMFATTQPYNTMGSATMVSGFPPSIHFESEAFPASHMPPAADYGVGPLPGVSTAQSWDMHPATTSAFDTGNSLWPTAPTYLPAALSATNSPLLDPYDLTNPLLVASPPSDFGDSYTNSDLSLGLGYHIDAYSDYSLSQAPTPISRSPSHSPVDNTSSGSSGFKCSLCGETFVNQKNLDRHFLSERHNENAPKYTCACGYVQARKDNYRRHLQSCSFHIDYSYVCSCGDRTLDKAYHVAHIDKCGRKRRGKQSSK